jgi:hypothetical protein
MPPKRQVSPYERRDLRIQKRHEAALRTENETAEQRAARMETDRVSRSASRAAETAESRAARLQANRASTSASRAAETAESRAARLEANRASTFASKAAETAEQKAARLETDRMSRSASRAAETAESRAARLQANRASTSASRAAETAESRSARLQANRASTSASRAAETAESRAARLEANTASTSASRAAETAESRAARLEANTASTSASRAAETTEQNATRLQKDRAATITARNEPWQRKSNAAFSYDSSIDYNSDPLVTIGTMMNECNHCHALKWKGETPGMCCSGGKVTLPPLAAPPEPLLTLLTTTVPDALHFQANMRNYNSCFQMTSFAATKRIIEPGYMPTFKIQGQVYHRIGSLQPLANEESQFLQIYFMGDQVKQAEQRCNNIPATKMQIVQPLQNMLNQENELIKSFKCAMETITPEYNIIIHADKTPAGEHERRFNAPTTSEVAVILAGQPHGSRDIVLQLRDDSLKKISETHRSYDALQYPLIFAKGEDGYYIELKHVDPLTGMPTNKKVSAMEFYAYRMMFRAQSFNNILRYKELGQQFWTDMYAKIESIRLNFLRFNQKQLRVDDYVHLKDAINNDGDAENVGKLVILPATFTGGMYYVCIYCQSLDKIKIAILKFPVILI